MKKKLTILLSLFVFYITGVCFAESTVHEKLVQALMSFEKDYPEYKNQAYLTDADGYPTTGDGNRTWQQQMVIILERPNSYPNISERFKDEFKVQLPAKLGDMTPKMLTWWEKEIMAQAGKVLHMSEEKHRIFPLRIWILWENNYCKLISMLLS